MSGVVAVDLGGTKTAMALVDRAGKLMDKRKVAAAHTLDGTISQLAQYLSGVEADAAGIIVPGIYDPHTGEAWAPNLWGHKRVPLRDELQPKLNIPLVISSDRSGYVLGEQWLGRAQGLQDVVFIGVGTGIGVGILSGGRLIEGAGGIAGAAGWMIVGGPWNDAYTNSGCWETEAAGPAAARRAGMESAEQVIAAARAGDSNALDVLLRTADYLALGVANLISILNPEMVVLGGGFMQAGDLMLDRIRTNALRWTQPIAALTTKIEQTSLSDDAGLLGAARLAWGSAI